MSKVREGGGKKQIVKNKVGGREVQFNLDNVNKYTGFFWTLPLIKSNNFAFIILFNISPLIFTRVWVAGFYEIETYSAPSKLIFRKYFVTLSLKHIENFFVKVRFSLC